MKRLSNLKILLERRKILRKNQTKEEIILWDSLKDKKLGSKFRRQHSMGPYILDFYCTNKKLAIELDGNQHKDAIEYDKERENLFIFSSTLLIFLKISLFQNLMTVIPLSFKKFSLSLSYSIASLC